MWDTRLRSNNPQMIMPTAPPPHRLIMPTAPPPHRLGAHDRVAPDAEPSYGDLNQSMSEGPLQPAHNAVAEVFCNVESRHLVQVGITDFFGDLLRPPYCSIRHRPRADIGQSRFPAASARRPPGSERKIPCREVSSGELLGGESLCVEREELEKLGSQGTRLDSDQSGPTQVPSLVGIIAP
jgi:hypothetical protein